MAGGTGKETGPLGDTRKEGETCCGVGASSPPASPGSRWHQQQSQTLRRSKSQGGHRSPSSKSLQGLLFPPGETQGPQGGQPRCPWSGSRPVLPASLPRPVSSTPYASARSSHPQAHHLPSTLCQVPAHLVSLGSPGPATRCWCWSSPVCPFSCLPAPP